MNWQLLVCSGSIATNGFGLGEVAEPEAKYNYKTLKLKTND